MRQEGPQEGRQGCPRPLHSTLATGIQPGHSLGTSRRGHCTGAVVTSGSWSYHSLPFLSIADLADERHTDHLWSLKGEAGPLWQFV